MSSVDLSRRRLLGAGVGAVVCLPLGRAAAEESPLKRAEDGHAHEYVTDAADAADHPRYEEGQTCRNCTFWRQEVEDEWGPCVHPEFRDVLVNANGWCEVHAPA